MNVPYSFKNFQTWQKRTDTQGTGSYCVGTVYIFKRFPIFRENQRKLEEELRLEEERKKKDQEKSRFSNFGFSSFNRFKR